MTTLRVACRKHRPDSEMAAHCRWRECLLAGNEQQARYNGKESAYAQVSYIPDEINALAAKTARGHSSARVVIGTS